MAAIRKIFHINPTFLPKISVPRTYATQSQCHSFGNTQNLRFWDFFIFDFWNFLIFGNSFRAAATGRIFLILKSLTCTSSNVVYLAECVLCGLQGVGSTANFKSRLANYKSHIKHKRRTCSITNHFIDVHEADHSSLKFMLIDQHHSEVLKSENFWIGMLLTNRKGLNGSHDFAQQ